jgi:2-phosphosulfolactate phosphatase
VKYIRAILTPAELPDLRQSDLHDTVCVVFDILRATSTFVTALNHGAKRVIPVSEIAAALAWREKDPGVLLAGERNGVKIGAALTGGRPFDLGNSPREFGPETVRDKTIVSTTTNGTRALNACRAAQTVLAGSFLNLGATAGFLLENPASHITLVCAGTTEHASLEDVLAAGALCDRLLAGTAKYSLSDSAAITWRTFQQSQSDLAAVLPTTDNGRRLMAIPELRADVAWCARTDAFPLVALLHEDALIGQSPPSHG